MTSITIQQAAMSKSGDRSDLPAPSEDSVKDNGIRESNDKEEECADGRSYVGPVISFTRCRVMS
jgi:hypothetical protein